MIKNIIFDCADTLLRTRYAECLAARTQKSPEQAGRIIRALMGSAIWKEYDNGRMTEEEIADALLPSLSEEDRAAARLFLSEFTDYFFMIDGTPELLAELKERGYRLFLLSDFPAKFTSLRSRFSIFDLFDGVVVSYQYGASKHDRGLFARLLEEYHLTAEECIFFDDVAANVEAAAAFGISGAVYTDVASVRSAIGLT